MAEIRGGFFENTDYKAEDFALSHEAIITQGVVADVTEDTKDALLVLPGEDMKILVNPGYCWIAGGVGLFFGCAPATVQLSVSSADATYTRIDRVIVRKDSNNKIFSIEILKGVASSAPEAPALTRNGTIDEICLAEITVPAGTIEITQSMIVDKRHDTSVCGISQSALNKIDTSKVFAGYEAQWAELMAQWAELMGQLAEDPAGNLQLQIGLLSHLETENKRNLVEAINEVNDKSFNTINGIPVNLTGIYNTQVIGYDEGQGKLVPMINVARTETVLPNYETEKNWIITNATNCEDKGDTQQILYRPTVSGEVGRVIGYFKNPYMLSEFTSFSSISTYTTSANIVTKYGLYIRFSKTPDFSEIDAEFYSIGSTTLSGNITNLKGNYYVGFEFGMSYENASSSYSFGLSKLTFS